MHIHYIQNHSLSGLGMIQTWIEEHHHTVTGTVMDADAVLPPVDDFDLLIVLGGIMGAYEEDAYPWLIKEKEFIREAVKRKKFVLGICLGAQLIADALGGKAYPHAHQEIGWCNISLNEQAASVPFLKGLPENFTAFQFHGDTFLLPEGAKVAASNEACANQLFVYGEHVVGAQFHPEYDEQIISHLMKYSKGKLAAGPYVQDAVSWLNQEEHKKNMKAFLYTLLGNIEESAQEVSKASKLSCYQ
ncbi:type 1 glutamine amidotransferase [Pontibacter silvestris]|uniref:Type 1 glutamine amidotransferase n=1 Tax=Pontibacter silvestris TaxID=2305183 RepID=A0ABW4X2Y4_9BACT|nr:type 1 glutamine amidotransferase [Pontibacter silvestris]MCC9137125.1 type 1 glutamine amidotransferase [Pontibacter silvestris]